MAEDITIKELELKLNTTIAPCIERFDLLNQLVVYYLNVDLNKTKLLIEEALTIAEALHYQEGIGISIQQYGVYYYLLADFENALKCYLKADIILSENSNWKNRIKPKANIAMVYMHTHQYEEALRIYKEIEVQLNSVPVDLIHAQMYINIDAAYCFLNDPENGIRYSKNALAISEQLNNRYGMAISESNLAGHLILLNKPDDALDHLAVSEQLCLEDGYNAILIGNMVKYTDCYLRLKQYDVALAYAEKGMELAKKNTDIEKEVLITKLKIDIYEQQEDFKNAFYASKNYTELKEKMLDNEKIKSFNALQLKYETDKKEADLNRLKLLQTETELTALKSQMNPHFIFNALNSIQELYTIGDKKMANEQMGNFAQLTRKILDVSGKQKIELNEEIEILTNYLELESMRFENDFSYQLNLSEDIDEDYVQLPPMLLQPYVENAIKHGLLHKKGEKQLTVNFSLNADETFLLVEITDNGIGRAASALLNKNKRAAHTSFATSATQKRLDLLNKDKATNVAVLFDDVLDELQQIAGTKVSIQIPLN
jgi:two-component system LytT family sensor kinase